MIDSTPAASGAVVDEGAAGPTQPVVEADAGGQAEEAREDALAQARQGARPVALQGEQVLAGPEDRSRCAGGWAPGADRCPRSSLRCRAHHRGTRARRRRRRTRARRSPCRRRAARRRGGAAFEQLEADLALVAPGIGQRERPRRAVGRAEGVQAKAPEPARVGGAVAVAGDLAEGRALGRLTAAAASTGVESMSSRSSQKPGLCCAKWAMSHSIASASRRRRLK